ncbi:MULTISPECIES: neuraminidase-like domain-containing protein [unclassified Pseudomonas]|uniref:Tc toxin subunit A-related protein n=4 Tax=Pseudomonas TaxID=286 RepID=UPI000C86CA2C|nr:MULTISPECIES: neuraminidase-like domain-containing protein [unclassified Pseudomonas]PMV19926.1 insecticidal toxin complex protein [Pseudomonas sp. FW305-3-2-15-C-TSA2]PMV31129.1 insecticidal toxin complex protein [Pseudomonas sp. DP16D-L5]PMV45927.1 insecticidal toxin complex protein [Pseudomonas sp. FW305-3-2-15-C-R2A1]PMV46915.1 insecticidal toxin complex protein [Pseudomonas sp. FW305-3-2-15-C-LB1]PMV62404.1 insecticidal toxin complex protein [Pseudomonas sp. FW305-3-2-15-C-LB3]
MNSALENSLNQTKRDALVSYYLQYVIPDRELGTLATNIKTADDLYEYLLLDPQVSGQVTTSRIAEAIASVQLYIHRCRQYLEPGVSLPAMAEASRPGRYLDQWDAYNKRYATWAGLQLLLHYPASYLDPALRYRKTTLFKNLEQTINQGRVTEERVEQAMRDYVGELRAVLDIRSFSAYQVEPDVSDTPVYFLGRSLDQDGDYYWRYVDGSSGGVNGRLRNPVAWSEWSRIQVPIKAEGDPAIVYFNHRVHVMWLHKKIRKLQVDKASSSENDVRAWEIVSWELHLASLQANGQWAQRSYPLEHLIPSTDLVSPTRLFAAELREEGSSADRPLGVFFVQQETNTNVRYLCLLNKLLQHIDSPGKSWEFNFNYDIESVTTHTNYPVFPPLKYQARLAPPIDTLTVAASARAEDNTATLTDFRITSGALSFTSTPKNHDDHAYFVTLTKGGGIEPLYSSIEIRTNANKRVRLPTGYSQQVIASNHGITIRLFLITTFPEYSERIVYDVPLVRAVFDQPAKITNFTPNVNWWMVTSPKRLGHSQIFHLRSNGTNGGAEHVMTTLGGPLLEQRMQEGTDVLLSWNTQAIPVDPSGSNWGGTIINTPMRFEGGIGQYTWELFFHVPFLIANRLLAEQRFDEAERWFKRIFNPAGYRKEDGSLDMIGSTPRFWNVQPLQQDTTWNTSSPENTYDPDLIAANDPMHYKLAVYLRWLELLLARGDHLYRQQNRDSLTEAKMWYIQALQLLGKRPAMPLLLNWADPTLGQASVENSVSLKRLEKLFDDNPKALAPGLVGQIQVTNGPFKAPFDDALLDYWRRVEQRLFNLRNNLSLDGQPLILRLFEEPVSPTALQQARQAGDGSDPAPSMAGLGLWSQRFPLLLERARTAVQQVIQFGSNLQGILERRDADALGVLQQTQQGALLGMANEVHLANIASLEHNLASLQASLAGVKKRQLHYKGLYDRHITDNEQRAMDLRTSANDKQLSAGALTTTAALLNQIPTHFTAGMAYGIGYKEFGGLAQAAAKVLELDAQSNNGKANKLEASEQYARRREEWQALRDQSAHDIAQLDAQILSATEQITMANKQSAQTEREQAYNQAVLDTLSTRFNSQTLFNWQAGRLAALYYQLYDLAVDVCARAQRSYQWETGDTTAYLRPGNWSDTYQGLLAGEGLLQNLQHIENRYLDWDRRTLEVQRTVSLQQLSKQTMSHVVRDLLNNVTSPSKPEVIEVSLASDLLAIKFNLNTMQINDDYPSALNLGTLRQIKTLSVSLPVVLGPYQEVQAVLQYASTHSLADGCKAIALSHGLDDNGQFQLDFNDGKYFPFESIPINEGVFVLSFPNATTRQRELLISLTDVILHIRYTIRQAAVPRTATFSQP